MRRRCYYVFRDVALISLNINRGKETFGNFSSMLFSATNFFFDDAINLEQFFGAFVRIARTCDDNEGEVEQASKLVKSLHQTRMLF